MTTPTLTIDGAPVAVVPVKPTEVMAGTWLASPGYSAGQDWRAMLAASDPALTAAVVEMRDALAQMVRDWASDDPTAEGQDVVNRARAALARVEVSR